MLRKRYYILFVSRDEDGRVSKIPLPLQYVYGFGNALAIIRLVHVGDDRQTGGLRDPAQDAHTLV